MDHGVRDNVRAWLAWYKERRGWTNERLAEEIGVAEPTVTNVLNNRRSAGLDLVVKMHRKFGRSMDDLVDTMPGDRTK